MVVLKHAILIVQIKSCSWTTSALHEIGVTRPSVAAWVQRLEENAVKIAKAQNVGWVIIWDSKSYLSFLDLSFFIHSQTHQIPSVSIIYISIAWALYYHIHQQHDTIPWYRPLFGTNYKPTLLLSSLMSSALLFLVWWYVWLPMPMLNTKFNQLHLFWNQVRK